MHKIFDTNCVDEKSITSLIKHCENGWSSSVCTWLPVTAVGKADRCADLRSRSDHVCQTCLPVDRFTSSHTLRTWSQLCQNEKAVKTVWDLPPAGRQLPRDDFRGTTVAILAFAKRLFPDYHVAQKLDLDLNWTIAFLPWFLQRRRSQYTFVESVESSFGDVTLPTFLQRGFSRFYHNHINV